MSVSVQAAAFGGHEPVLPEDAALLPQVVAAVQTTGQRLLERFASSPHPKSRSEVVAAVRANDDAALAVLRPALSKARPGVAWDDDEAGDGPLPPSEWWVTDPVEGNVNYVHGLGWWGVTATLVRDNVPVLTAVHLPMPGTTYTAVRGGGAFQDGVRLRASGKRGLDGALVGTGQAEPGEDLETYRRLGLSVTAMLGAALLVRVAVPATLELAEVAAGRADAFWQFSRVRSGLLAGALLVTEAEGRVTDTRGAPWTLESDDFLAAAPGVHAAAVQVLSHIR